MIHAPVVLDVAGLALDADDRRRLQHPLTGGLVLFARNFSSRGQLTELAAEIKSIRPDALELGMHGAVAAYLAVLGQRVGAR